MVHLLVKHTPLLINFSYSNVSKLPNCSATLVYFHTASLLRCLTYTCIPPNFHIGSLPHILTATLPHWLTFTIPPCHTFTLPHCHNLLWHTSSLTHSIVTHFDTATFKRWHTLTLIHFYPDVLTRFHIPSCYTSKLLYMFPNIIMIIIIIIIINSLFILLKNPISKAGINGRTSTVSNFYKTDPAGKKL